MPENFTAFLYEIACPKANKNVANIVSGTECNRHRRHAHHTGAFVSPDRLVSAAPRQTKLLTSPNNSTVSITNVNGYMKAISRFYLLSFLLYVASTPRSSAQPYTFTWDPGQSGFDWHDSGNWLKETGSYPDDHYDRAVFNTSGASPILTRNVQGNVGNGLGQLDFQTSGWSINNEAGGDYTIFFNSVQYYSYNAIYSRAAGVNYINTKIEFNNSGQNIFTGTGNTLVLGRGITGSYAPIIDSLNPTSDDTGAVRLDVASSVSGYFFLRQGTLLVRHSQGLGTNPTLYIGGDQWVTDGANARLLTDASGVTISQNVTVRTYSDHQVNATIGGNQTTGASAFSGTITLNRDTRFTSANTDNNSVAFNNTISGPGGVTKIGPGTVEFNYANTYQGQTVVNAGRLRLGTSGALPSSTSVTLANVVGAVLDLNGYDQAINSLDGGGSNGGWVTLGTATLALQAGDYAGVISGSGGVTKVGSGTLTLSGANSYSGPTYIYSGTLAYGANNVIGTGPVTISGPTAVLNLGSYSDTVGTVTLDNGAQITGSGTLNSSSSFELKKGVVTASLGGTATLNKTGNDTVTLGTANTFSGDTRIQQGTLTLSHSMALQNSTLDLNEADTGILDLNSLDVTLGGLKGVRDLAIPDGKTLSVGYNNSSTSYAGHLSGKNVILQKIGNGTLVLTADSTYSGTTRINAGILQIGNGGASGWIDTPVENHGTFSFHRSDNVTFSKSISGPGSLAKLGTGTLTLSADNSYSGNTTITEGTLLVNGNYTGNGNFQVGGMAATKAVLGGTGTIIGNLQVLGLGEISPGTSIGTLTVQGDVSFDTGGTLRIELDSEGAGSADLLLVSDLFDISNATVEFSAPASLDDPAYVFVTYGTLKGQRFQTVRNLPNGYRIDYNYSGLNQIAVVVPEPTPTPLVSLLLLSIYAVIRRLNPR